MTTEKLTLQLAALPQFEATPVRIGGLDFLLIPVDALAGLYRPAAVPDPKPEPEDVKPTPKARAPRTARKVQQMPKPSSAKQASSPAVPADGTAKAKVLQVLRQKPMTSGEVITAAGIPAPNVYTALSELRKEGAVVTERREGDVMAKNYLKAS